MYFGSSCIQRILRLLACQSKSPGPPFAQRHDLPLTPRGTFKSSDDKFLDAGKEYVVTYARWGCYDCLSCKLVSLPLITQRQGASLRHESILRQVALVSYGTRFLRKEIELEDWYRHGVFFDSRLQFRDVANALLADDFTLWLDILRESGATRLSLHLPAQLEIDQPRAWRGGDHVVVAHYDDRHDIWAVGTELPAWSAHPSRHEDRWIPNSTSWGGALDTYWRVEERPGKLEVANTNWKELIAAIAIDLDLAIPASAEPASPFYMATSRDMAWARFPLFPASKVSAPAHRLLTILDSEERTFANDTHPKNENSDYRFMSDADASEVMRRGRRLRSWLTEVLLRCANECRTSDLLTKGAPLVRLQEPPSGFERAAVAVAAVEEDTGAKVENPKGKWMARIGSAIGFAALCLLVVAIANIIARFPWLSVLIGLPWVLYLKFRRNSQSQHPPHE